MRTVRSIDAIRSASSLSGFIIPSAEGYHILGLMALAFASIPESQ